MNLYEVQKDCATCKKRVLDSNSEIKCSLAEEKPSDISACGNYVADYGQIAKGELGKSISGWLFVFLWLGVGCGALLSVIMALVDLSTNEYSAFFVSLYCLMIGALSVTAVATIVAFYKRKNNAVSLAVTYIAMILLDGVFAFSMAAISNDSIVVISAIRQFVWGGVWLAYLIMSDKVEAVIPKVTRVWGALEKITISVYVLSVLTFISSFAYVAENDNPRNIILTNESYITQVVIEANKELPAYVSEDVVFFRINHNTVGEKSVEFVYILQNVSVSDFDEEYLEELGADAKDEILTGLGNEVEEDEFLLICFKEGYNVVYRYCDASSATLYAVRITPAEYENAKEFWRR